VTAYAELVQRALTAPGGWLTVESPSRPRVTVYLGTCSIAAGAGETLAALRSEVEQRRLDVDLGIAGCNGLCYAEPLVEVAWPPSKADAPTAGDGRPPGRILYGKLTEDKVPRLVEEALAGGGPPKAGSDLALASLGDAPVDGVPPIASLPFWAPQVRRLMANCGVIDPENIDHYIARGGYSGLARAVTMAPEEVIKEVSDSTLRGRSGSDFPTGRKWDFLRGATRQPKYLVCNADEGDPGAWVNRMLLEGNPHAILEGMAIGAHATGASYGFIYVREEYPLCFERLNKAIEQARERGLFGSNILGSDLSFDAKVVRGAGSYVCGEESGLIASVEGMRGMPKIRPPYPAQAGVYGQPTNVNNVETYADAALILGHGLEWYASLGTERNKSTKMFSLSGDVQRVGVVEVPLGYPMDKLIFEAAGGVPEGRTLKAIQPGGPLAGILPAVHADLPLEPEAFREKGVQMGGGGLVIIDDSACIVNLCTYFEWFAEDESCGRCTTCRGGTQRLVEILRRWSRGEGRESDFENIKLLGNTMLYSNCVHGQAAPTVALNTLTFFEDEVREHVFEKRCRAKVCKGLIRYQVSSESVSAHPELVEGLAEAEAICPTNAVVKKDGSYEIDQSLCIKCNACREVAPQAIEVVDAFPA
jgi:NADH:ubiquinone oxidoreductase subunit F (NADH-binding)/(2Fe-2S) ferredoxin/ferredoxin-like protein FixX